MTLDNRYRCTAVDPNTGAIRFEALNSKGTVTLSPHGLMTVVIGKVYHFHVEVAVWSGDHVVEIQEEP